MGRAKGTDGARARQESPCPGTVAPDAAGQGPRRHRAPCITVGTLLLLFVAYQLWGTGIREAQAQDQLGNKFDKVLRARPPDVRPAVEAPADRPGRPRASPPPSSGSRRSAWTRTSSRASASADLKKGPGHYPETPLPGQEGNAAIAGHRTTYGAPFNRVDELEPGDEIIVETVQGKFRYVVKDEDGDGDGHMIVSPSQVEVLEDKGDNRLTLTACHPKLSARQRIVVVAELGRRPGRPRRPGDRRPRPASTTSAARPRPACPPSSSSSSAAPSGSSPTASASCGRSGPPTWCACRSSCVGLFFFFEEFSRMLPSNF